MAGNITDIGGANGGGSPLSNGICPFISTSQLVQVSDPSGLIKGPVGLQAAQALAP